MLSIVNEPEQEKGQKSFVSQSRRRHPPLLQRDTSNKVSAQTQPRANAILLYQSRVTKVGKTYSTLLCERTIRSILLMFLEMQC